MAFVAIALLGLSTAWVGPGSALGRARADGAGGRAPFTTEPGVVLTPPLRSALTRLAGTFQEATGRSFHVTSGARTPHEQAVAMFEKLLSGGSLTGLYRDYDAARELERAYQRARRQGRGQCVRAMRRVLERQIARGCFISRHLHQGAVDIRSRDMTTAERRTFRRLASRQRGMRVLEEGRPPHFHLEIRSSAD
jgi:hypothetical protein